MVQQLRVDFTKEMTALRTNLNTMNSKLLTYQTTNSLPPPASTAESLIAENASNPYLHPTISSMSQTFNPNQAYHLNHPTLMPPPQQMMWRHNMAANHHPY